MDKATQQQIIEQAKVRGFVRAHEDIRSEKDLRAVVSLGLVHRYPPPAPLCPSKKEAFVAAMIAPDGRISEFLLPVLLTVSIASGGVMALVLNEITPSTGVLVPSVTMGLLVGAALSWCVALAHQRAQIIRNIWHAQLWGANPDQLEMLRSARQFVESDLAQDLLDNMIEQWRVFHKNPSAQDIMGWPDPRASDHPQPLDSAELFAIVTHASPDQSQSQER